MVNEHRGFAVGQHPSNAVCSVVRTIDSDQQVFMWVIRACLRIGEPGVPPSAEPFRGPPRGRGEVCWCAFPPDKLSRRGVVYEQFAEKACIWEWLVHNEFTLVTELIVTKK